MTDKPISRRIFTGDSLSTGNFQALGAALGNFGSASGGAVTEKHSASTANFQALNSTIEKVIGAPSLPVGKTSDNVSSTPKKE
jgi:hypothetical protein